MIGKITKGSEFAGCVAYVLREDKARLLAAEGVSGTPEEMAEQFELQTLLNDKVKNTVGHISLSFSPEDGDRLRNDDRLMVKIAYEYMGQMGIRNTQFIIARHTDRQHPHCHIVFNRVDNNGKTISDKNDRYRNEKVCKQLTEKYGLYMADGKEHVNTERLRPHDKAKYDIYEALKQELPKVTSWEQLREALHKQGILTEFKYSRTSLSKANTYSQAPRLTAGSALSISRSDWSVTVSSKRSISNSTNNDSIRNAHIYHLARSESQSKGKSLSRGMRKVALRILLQVSAVFSHHPVTMQPPPKMLPLKRNFAVRKRRNVA